MENIFNIDDDFIRHHCRSRERVQSDSNAPIFPNKDFFDICLEGANELEKNKEILDIVRDKLK